MELQAKAYEDTTDAFELKDYAALKIEGITDDITQTANEKTAKELSYSCILDLQSRVRGDLKGLSTGLVLHSL